MFDEQINQKFDIGVSVISSDYNLMAPFKDLSDTEL